MHFLIVSFSQESNLVMGGIKVVLLVLGVLMLATPCCYGISVACMAVYDEGGAPAVFRSPACYDWVLSAKAHQNKTMNCQFETTQGRRRYQEDQISCNLDMQIPLLGKNGPEDVRVGVVAVFDGHIGKEASEMASKVVLDYFFVHSVFGSFKSSLSLKEEAAEVERISNLWRDHGYPSKESLKYLSFDGVLQGLSDGSRRGGNLKKALVETINDIDSAFTEAFENHSPAGSTAVVALLVDGQILVANVGDSKALLCSEKLHTRQESNGTVPYLYYKELTIDHNPHRDEERARIEIAGGIISGYRDMLLINGHFPMTRAIGDIPLKRYGIIADPEVTDWQPLTADDSYLVVASDGIFESLSPQEVCNLLQDAHFQDKRKSKQSGSCLDLDRLANCIVRNAFEEGSSDNLSAVLVPLRSAGFSPVKA